jgi:signal transduction histidine kinase
MLGRSLHIPKTSIWRFTFVFSAVVLLVAGGILAFVYEETLGYQRDELKQRVLISANSFLDLSSTAGVSEDDFLETLTSRAQKTTSQVLALKQQERVFGNISRLPDASPDYPELSYFPVAVIGDHQGLDIVPVVGTLISTRYGDVLVGFFDTNRELEERFIMVSAISLVSALLVSLWAGFLFNRRVLRRVTEISTILEKVESGRLRVRLPVSDKEDEYDLISRQVNKMLDEIDELLQSVSTVTDNIAHDLRTPLSRIRIRLEEAASTSVLGDDDHREFYQALILELDQVIDTFNAMLELSRMESSVSKTEMTPCSLEKISEDVVELLAPVAEGRVNLCYECQGHSSVIGDANLLFRAIYNLVDNAVIYTPDGGDIKVLVKGRQVLIEDNGPGIPEMERERVFRRLYRLDKSRHDNGFGMGLAIVKAIIEQHEGTVILEDAQPGLRVIVSL